MYKTILAKKIRNILGIYPSYFLIDFKKKNTQFLTVFSGGLTIILPLFLILLIYSKFFIKFINLMLRLFSLIEKVKKLKLLTSKNCKQLNV